MFVQFLYTDAMHQTYGLKGRPNVERFFKNGDSTHHAVQAGLQLGTLPPPISKEWHITGQCVCVASGLHLPKTGRIKLA